MDLNISGPTSIIVKAIADVTVAICASIDKNRDTMSGPAREQQDHIQAQAYWDWRAFLQKIGLVGDPMPWPPTLPPK